MDNTPTGDNRQSEGGAAMKEKKRQLQAKSAQLEARNAELLEALKEIFEQTDGRNLSTTGQDRAHSIARSAIAKAKGETL